MLSAKLREAEKYIEGMVQAVYPNSTQGVRRENYSLPGSQQLCGAPEGLLNNLEQKKTFLQATNVRLKALEAPGRRHVSRN